MSRFGYRDRRKTRSLQVCGLRLLLFLFLTGTALAHSPETSYCRVTIGPHEVEFKFTYDLLTLQRMAAIDTNGDDKLSHAELEAAAPAIQSFLRQHIYLDLNEREAEFAEADPPTWPEVKPMWRKPMKLCC